MDTMKPKAVSKRTSVELLSQMDEVAIWKALLTCGDERIILKTMIYLTDRRDGKAVQAVDVNSAGAFTLALGNLLSTRF